MKTLTAEELHHMLHYDADTGVFTWRFREERDAQWNTRWAGKRAGFRFSTRLGYRSISISGTRFFEHRLAWLYSHGAWPIACLDHINGDASDNRIANLRECTRAENAQNQKRHKSNTSGYAGVYWHANDQKWVARIGAGGRRYALGYFSSPLDAHNAYLQAKSQLHTFEPNQRTA